MQSWERVRGEGASELEECGRLEKLAAGSGESRAGPRSKAGLGAVGGKGSPAPPSKLRGHLLSCHLGHPLHIDRHPQIGFLLSQNINDILLNAT